MTTGGKVASNRSNILILMAFWFGNCSCKQVVRITKLVMAVTVNIIISPCVLCCVVLCCVVLCCVVCVYSLSPQRLLPPATMSGTYVRVQFNDLV